MNAEWQQETLFVQNADMPGYTIEYGMSQIRCHECYASFVVFVLGERTKFCPNCGAGLRFPRHMRSPEPQRFKLVPIDEAELQREFG